MADNKIHYEKYKIHEKQNLSEIIFKTDESK